MITKLHHVGIAVKDLDEAMHAYRALGLAVEKVQEVESEKVRVAFLPVGETHLELLEPTDPSSPVARFLEKRGPGLHHLCFAVENIRESMARAQEAGLVCLDAAPRRGAEGDEVCFFHPKSTGGVLIELWQGRDA